jgi:pseudouridine-5'-phosphate glycosidase
MSIHDYLSFSSEAQEALNTHQPCVVLESTVITHGLPFPQNLELAYQLENLVRQEGCTPITVALMEGKIKIGLTDQDKEHLSNPLQQSQKPLKISSMDIASALSTKSLGGTTVAATCFIANLIHCGFFATGGIGGVHRYVEETWDVSHDCQALTQYPVAVVCSGAKSLLDLEKTLEYLETLGVPLWGLRTTHFPAFYTRHSPFPLQWSTDREQELSDWLSLHWQCHPQRGVLVLNPVPESHDIPWIEMESMIQQACEEWYQEKKQGRFLGKAVTPYLLKKIAELTKGKSLETNLSLLKNNASTAARLAKIFHLAKKEKND